MATTFEVLKGSVENLIKRYATLLPYLFGIP